MIKKITIIGALVSLSLLSGCASQVYNTKSLKQTNRFAVVSVTGLTSGFGMSAAEETKLVTSVEKVVQKELKNAKGFKLVPSSKVLRNRHYRAIKSESTDGLVTTKVAKGFKKFEVKNETDAVAKLRKDLKLSGVIQVVVSFTKKDSSMWLSGFLPIPIPVSGGVTRGEIHLAIVAYDSKNEVIWQDAVTTETEGSVGNVMGLANLSSLYPQLIDAAQSATNTAVARLNEKLL